MKEEIEGLLEQTDVAYQEQASIRRIQQFGQSIHWIGVATLGYALIGFLFQAWPVALLKPEWMQKISQALTSSSFFFLGGIVLILAAPLFDPETQFLDKRAKLAQRVASWLAILYLLLIPLQVYAGYKLLQQSAQEQQTNLSNSQKAINRIQQASTWAEVRQAYSQIPGRKPPIPQAISQPFGTTRDKVADALTARLKAAETDAEQKQAKSMEEWLIRTGFNLLQMLMLFLGFAAIGRTSANRPTLLEGLITKKRSRSQVPGY